MKKIKLLLPLAALSAGALAGCGPTTPSFNGVTVAFWHTFGDKVEASIIKKATAFSQLVKEEEGVDVRVVPFHLGGYNDVYRIVGSALSAGNGPTMTISYADSVASLMADETYEGQYIVDVEDYFDDPEIGFGTDEYLGDDKEGTSDFVQSYLKEGQQFEREGTFVMPFMKSSEIMMYNKTAAVSAYKKWKGQEATTAQAVEFIESMSWNDLMELAKVCVDNKEELGFGSMDYPVYYDADANMLITQIEQAGLEYSYLEDGEVKLGLDYADNAENAEAVKDMLMDYANWHYKKYFTTKKTEGTYASDSFKNQKCFFTIGSSGGAGYSFPEKGAFDLGVCRVPYFGDHDDTAYQNAKFISQGPSIAFCNDKSISAEANAQNLKYAWKFYKYLTNTQNNVELCVNGSEGYIPVRESCYASEDWAAFMEEIEDGNNYAICAKLLRDKVNGKYLTSLVFNGSATYRTEMDGLMGEVSKTTSETTIKQLMATAINNTRNAMRG